MAKRRLKKLFSCVLALSMCMSILSVSAFAEGEEDGGAPETPVITTEVTGSGTAEDPKVTTTTTETTSDDGKTTTTETDKTWQGTSTDPEGATDDDDRTVETIVGDEQKTQTIVKDEQGRVTQDSGKIDGKETSTSTTTSTETKDDVVQSENTNTVSGTPETSDPTYVTDTEVSTPTPDVQANVDLVYGDGKNYGDITVNLEPDGHEYSRTESPNIANKIPTSTLEPGVYESTNEDGDAVKTTVTEMTDAEGNVVGYTTTVETTHRGESKTDSDEKSEMDTPTVTPGNKTSKVDEKVAITLPNRPEETESTDASGNKTVVKVVEIKDEKTGEVVGYQANTTVTDAAGKEISHASNSVWGTKTTTTTTTVTKPTTTETVTHQTITTTTTTPITKGTTTTGVSISATDREVRATMYQVQTGAGNGELIDVTTPVPNMNKEPSIGSVNNFDTHLRNTGDEPTVDFNPDGSQYQWLGEYGLESAILVNAKHPNGDSSNGWNAHQFILEDKDGKTLYVYCADFAVTPRKGVSVKVNGV